jgi:hypothetical protein
MTAKDFERAAKALPARFEIERVYVKKGLEPSPPKKAKNMCEEFLYGKPI